MSAFGHTLRGPRSRRATFALVSGVAALAVSAVGTGSAHAAESGHNNRVPIARHTASVVDRTPAAVAAGASAVVVPAAFTSVATTTTVAANATTASVSSGFVAPLASLRITEPYGVAGPWAAGHHTGVDLAAAVGTSLRSVGAGTVVRSGWDGAYGIDVLVKLEDGKYALYGHLSRAFVSAGAVVQAGQQIGLSGATGHVTGPHLHFEVRTTLYYGSDINPITYLQGHGVTI